MSLLKYDIIKKVRVDKITTQQEFESSNDKDYKIKRIWNSTVYTRKSENHLVGFYYYILWKRYLKEENTWEFILAI